MPTTSSGELTTSPTQQWLPTTLNPRLTLLWTPHCRSAQTNLPMPCWKLEQACFAILSLHLVETLTPICKLYHGPASRSMLCRLFCRIVVNYNNYDASRWLLHKTMSQISCVLLKACKQQQYRLAHETYLYCRTAPLQALQFPTTSKFSMPMDATPC